jgi:hypothetical protein
MKTITKEYKVYGFNELSDDVKDKVIEIYYHNEDYPFLNEDIKEQLKFFDNDYNNIFSDTKIQYSFSYSQSDGLSFSGNIDLLKFIKCIYSKKLPIYKIDIICNYVYSVCSEGNKNRYCYTSKNQIVFEYSNNYKEYNRIENLWQDVLSEIQDYYISICGKLEKYCYTELEYRMDYEDFSEYAEGNEIVYLENGTIFNE